MNLLNDPIIGRNCLCIAVELRHIAVPLNVSLIVSINASIVSRYFLNEVFCQIQKITVILYTLGLSSYHKNMGKGLLVSLHC